MPWLTIITIVASVSALTILLRLCLRIAATSLAPVAVVGQRADRRTLWRMKVNCRATVAGISGTPSSLPARCANISDYGALLLAGEALDVGSQIVVNIPSLRLMGVGRVRHCRRKLLRYAVGIEFNGPLRRSDVGEWTIRKRR